jgi:hypothetical protein
MIAPAASAPAFVYTYSRRTKETHEQICPASRLRRSRSAPQKLMEIANSVEPVQDGRIFIELINDPFL